VRAAGIQRFYSICFVVLFTLCVKVVLWLDSGLMKLLAIRLSWKKRQQSRWLCAGMTNLKQISNSFITADWKKLHYRQC
jgi:hypothetical protein